MKWKPSPGMTEKQIQKELQRQLVHFDDEVKKGLVLDGNIKFQVYSEMWIENSQLAPKIKECYIILLQKINQALGDIRLNKFQKHHMQAFIKQLQEDHKMTDEKVIPKEGTFERIIKKHSTRKAAAEKIGLSASTITSISRRNKISMESAKKVSANLQVNIKSLFTKIENNTPLAESTIRKYYAIVTAILNQAVRDGIIPFNPADGAQSTIFN